MNQQVISGFCDPRFAEIEQQFSKAISSGFDTGASIAIEHEGALVVNLWGGYKDRGKTQPWLEDTLVNVFSTTKAIAATCILQLVERGRLDLNAKVAEYWPEYGCNGKEDTKVSDFLCHRAAMHGFQDGVPDFDFRDWDNWASTLAAQKPFRTPGSTQGYHALTYGWLVGELVKRVDGRNVGQYFREEIAEPFDLDFHIGLNESEITRCGDVLVDSQGKPWALAMVAMAPDFLLPKALRRVKKFLRMGDTQVAFASRAGVDMEREINSDEWREAIIPSANGHGTAKSLAKLFGVLSTGGQRDGHHLMNPSTLSMGVTPLSEGPDTVIFGAPIRFGVGYDLGLGVTTITSAPHPERIFGHCGIGGTVAFGDPEKGIGYGFTCNRMHKPQNLYRTSNQLTRTLMRILD